MRLPTVLVCILWVILSASFAFGAEFPWAMFVPATSGAGLCDAQNIEHCRTEDSCLKFGGTWFNSMCNSSITCSDIAGCYSGTMTDNCPGYWAGGKVGVTINSNCSISSVSQYGVKSYGTITARQGNVFSGSAQTDANGCGQFSITCTDNGTSISCNYRYTNGKTGSITNGNSSTCKSANQFLTESLDGNWVFNYTIGTSPFVDYYDLDIGTVREYPAGSGEYSIYGYDGYGNLVVGGYDPEYSEYSLFDSGTIIDQLYFFNYTNSNTIAGCYYQYSHNSGTWSRCYPMNGTRTSTKQAPSITKSLKIGTEKELQLLEEVEALNKGTDQFTEDQATLEMLNSVRDRFITN